MKKIYFFSLLAFMGWLATTSAKAQSYFTKQIIIVNGGNFSNPDDYVTVASYDPATGITTEFATIYTQAVQDVLIVPPFAYVAATDSIVKLNIDTYEKEASIAAPGVNQLVSNGEVLVASFWYPVTENFVRTYSLEDLAVLHQFGGVSDEAAGMMVMNEDFVLVAIPGAYGSTTGKVAVLDLLNNTVMDEDDFGEFFAGIGFFAQNNGQINVFMKTPYGGSSFNAATMDYQGEIVDQFTYDDNVLANPAGQLGSKLYVELNNGIGEYDLNTHEISNQSVVAQQPMAIAASVLDTLNNLFYLTTSDFYSMGAGAVYDMQGDSAGSFEAGISAQAIAVDYRENTGLNESFPARELTVFPNPASTTICFDGIGLMQENVVRIADVTGKIVYRANNSREINVSAWPAGIYFVRIQSATVVYTGKFIKN